MFPGFPTRLSTDIANQFKKEMAENKRSKTQKYKIGVIVSPHAIKTQDSPTRKNAVFIGAAVCASVMGNNPNFWITKEQYEDIGMREAIHNDGIA